MTQLQMLRRATFLTELAGWKPGMPLVDNEMVRAAFNWYKDNRMYPLIDSKLAAQGYSNVIWYGVTWVSEPSWLMIEVQK